MNNPRITARDRNVIKGGIMRAFSRSELRQNVLKASIIPGLVIEGRPKVKTWCKCNICGLPEAKSYMEVDHIEPKVPLYSSLEQMTFDQLVDNTWCEESNLQVLCKSCHKQKTANERKIRAAFKKVNKK